MGRVMLVTMLGLSALMNIGDGLHAGEPEIIAVIGTGRVGGALGPRLGQLGYPVIYGSRTPDSDRVAALVAQSGAEASAAAPGTAAAAADIVVLAVPWQAIDSTLEKFGALDGKIVIDITNALRMNAQHMMEMSVETSAGEIIQQRLPDARVIKAFNAMGSHVMADPAAGGGPVTVPLAGDDPAAKARVAEIVAELGFDSADVGPLKHARYLEGMAVLYMVPYMSGRTDDAFEYYLRSGTAPKRTFEVRPAE
jgi:predicted dinucleotide-binding enzyme